MKKNFDQSRIGWIVGNTCVKFGSCMLASPIYPYTRPAISMFSGSIKMHNGFVLIFATMELWGMFLCWQRKYWLKIGSCKLELTAVGVYLGLTIKLL